MMINTPSPRSTESATYDSRTPGAANKQGTFAARPQANQLALVKGGQQVKLLTNQFRLRLGQELSVYQYDLTVLPDHMSDSYIMQGVFKACKKKVDAILGLYIQSGRNVFTTTSLDETVTMNVKFRDIEYTIIIDATSKKYISGKHITQAKMEDHAIVHTLLNIIVKQAFRETNLRQIGKQPRFFDMSKAIDVEGSGLQACPGFRAAAYNYTSGLTIVIDSINKFISNKSCLSRMQEICAQHDIRDKEGRIRYEFQGKTVIGNYGYKKTYYVEEIDFKKTPVTTRFQTADGKKISIAEYFCKNYDLKITDPKQPLFIVKINGKECHIPPEFCNIDGVPETIREDPRRMRDVLGATRKNPMQKFKAIEDFSYDLFGQKALKDWGVIIDSEPIQIESQILPLPTIELQNGRQSQCDQNILRNLPIQVPASESLARERWAILYEKKHFN